MKNNMMQLNDEMLNNIAGGEHIGYEYTDESIGFEIEIGGYGFGFSIPRPW